MSASVWKTGQTFLEELGNHKAFKKELLLSMSQRRYLLSPSSCYPSRWGFFCPFSSLCQRSDKWGSLPQPRRGLTPRGSLECNPEIPAFPGSFIGLILGTEKRKDRRTPTGLCNSYWGSADRAFGTC